MKTSAAIITARGGSKGVPRKNVRPLNGKPLIQYTIDVARACAHVETVIVTTDCEEIRKVSIAAGAEAPFLRPPELSGDTAKQEDAILHCMQWLESAGRKHETICVLTPTNPLRQVATLDAAYHALADNSRAEALLSIAECSVSPLFCSQMPADGMLGNWIDEKYKWCNRQELPTYYRLTGLVAISGWDGFARWRTFVNERSMAFPVDEIEALDIDTPLDFAVAELLVRQGVHTSAELARCMAVLAG